MTCVNIPTANYKRSEKAPRNKYYIRVFATEQDGITTAWEKMIDHRPNASDYSNFEAECIALNRTFVLAALNAYDKSEAVNSFTLNGEKGWYPLEKRVGLRNSIRIEAEAQRENTTLFVNGKAIQTTTEKALSFLRDLELYAIDCNQRTETHRANINALQTVQEILTYDYTAEYPTKITRDL